MSETESKLIVGLSERIGRREFVAGAVIQEISDAVHLNSSEERMERTRRAAVGIRWWLCNAVTIALLTTGAAFAQTTASEERDASIRPFEIHVEESTLRDLQKRLDRTRFPDHIERSGWDYGTDSAYLKELIEYWRKSYDWRKHEEELNRLDHFTTKIDDLDIHFIHQRSKHKNALPLVITHGWPGSIYEFLKIIGPLTDPVAHGGRAEDAFHVICPSMPGYGFSDKPRVPGYNVARVGATVAELMNRLGYDRYAAQGGDWGASVSAWLGENDAEHVVGIHLNFVSVGPPNSADPNAGVSQVELQRRRARERELRNHWAYSQIQGTRPQTLGYGLHDSPVGLAAWIVDKFYAWSDCRGDIENSFTKDELLTNVMIYWVSGTITSSTRLYFESRNHPWPRGRVEVPTGVALFPKELLLPPRKWAESRYNIVHWTDMPRGGHFAAMEEPQLFVDDIRKFCRGLR